MASRALADLRQDIREKALLHINACASEGIDLLIYCTFRSNVEQNAEYAKGRTAHGAIVTNARGGQSKHNHVEDGVAASLAYDCIPIVNGKAQWGNASLVSRVGILGESVGLTWAGRWRGRLRESVHFEVSS